MLHDDYLCLVESGKQQIKEVRRKFNRKTWKQGQLLSESWFVLRRASPRLSRDRRIKMKKSNRLIDLWFGANLEVLIAQQFLFRDVRKFETLSQCRPLSVRCLIDGKVSVAKFQIWQKDKGHC